MEYTVQKLAALAGVSARTLRYYDQQGLLTPKRISSSGYRIYGADEVSRLQQILFYRELGVELTTIKQLLDSASFDAAQTLRAHHNALLTQRDRLEALICNVEKSISAAEGRTTMNDKDKFEGFKKERIDENERKYGTEIRAKYGDQVVDASNKKLMGMSCEQYEQGEALASEIIETLSAAMDEGDPAGKTAQRAAQLHKQWLSLYWNEYTKEAHAGVARMYVEDERFTAYYDQHKPGMARFLRDAVLVFTGQSK